MSSAGQDNGSKANMSIKANSNLAQTPYEEGGEKNKEFDPDITISDDEMEEEKILEEGKNEMFSSSLSKANNASKEGALTNSPSKKKYNQGRWSKYEHSLFIEGLVKYGNNWKSVQKNILTRSSTQARSHAQKFFMTCKKEISEKNPQQTNRENIYKIFSRSLQGKSFLPSEEFYDSMEKLILSSENKKDVISLEKPTIVRRKKKEFKKLKQKESKRKIFLISKVKREKKKNGISNFYEKNISSDSSKLNGQSGMGGHQKPLGQVINIVTINVLNNNKSVEVKKHHNPFNILFDTNDELNVNSNMNGNGGSNNLFDGPILSNIREKGQDTFDNINIDFGKETEGGYKSDDLDNFNYDMDYLFKSSSL